VRYYFRSERSDDIDFDSKCRSPPSLPSRSNGAVCATSTKPTWKSCGYWWRRRPATVQRNRRGGGLSGPAVSDRVQRLEEAGVIERFTVDVDQSQLRAGIPVFVRATVPAADVDDCKAAIADADAVEHVFVTADGECWFYARAQVQQVREWLDGLFPMPTVSTTTLR